MAKTTTQFICNGCGAQYPRWQGKCDRCDQWDTLVETITSTDPQNSKFKIQNSTKATPQKLSEIRTIDQIDRIKTGISEFDRVLGGGIVPGSLILIGGDPGIGKSTLLLQSLAGIAKNDGIQNILYISGEESVEQIKLRATRLGITDNAITLFSENSLEIIVDTISKIKPQLVIIDSIQTVSAGDVASGSGSTAQVKYATETFMQLAKSSHIPILIIGHVTKEGEMAGPKTLEHLVDAVLYLEGDRYQSFRILRGIKNRFGKTSEVGVFEMDEEGMQEVKNPSQFFLSERLPNATGVAVSAIIEGNRPFLVEIQALTSRSYFGFPKRTASGSELNRLNLLAAIIEKRAGFNLGEFDIFLNVVGGIKVRDNATDLATACAIMSAIKNTSLGDTTALFGELGLSGEVRSVVGIEKRVEEAARLGFKTIIPEMDQEFNLE